jgi:single stranded DNA-binding protein
MICTITVAGHAGGDAEINFLKDGSGSVTNFSVATSHYDGKDSDGDPKFITEWFRCAVWGKLGERAVEVIKKGTPVIVTGRLARKSFEITDEEGDRRRKKSWEITVVDFQVFEKTAKSGDGE